MARDEARYSHGHHASVLKSHTWRTAENSAAYLIPELEPDHFLLDVGCGPGTITADLARLVRWGRVVAVDREPAIVGRAAEHLAANGVHNAELRTADVLDLPFPDNAFDVAHAHQVLQHVSRPVDALRELRRVVRPGGLIAVRDADYGAMTWFPPDLDMETWRTLYQEIARSCGGEPNAARRLKAWCVEAGIETEDIAMTTSAWTYSTPEELEWWCGLWAERLESSELAAIAVEKGFASLGDLGRLAEAWRLWSQDPEAWFMVPHGEILARVD
ncbi:methyltransferase domain-containing protein [Salininema proteolyticum]|uniref:Methyltransferase domain-containing protein n=1 Tax=Salininema proteolyticum TaxID=1607685 RepID=A0ABV8TWV9_9ACTN